MKNKNKIKLYKLYLILSKYKAFYINKNLKLLRLFLNR